MITVTGIRFKPAGKIYYFKPNGLNLDVGDFVVVETARGLEFGEVVIASKDIEEEDPENPIKDVIRIATDDDAREHCDNIAKAKEAFKICAEKIKKHELDMKLIDVEYTLDRSKVLFYFVSDNRIDFRELVKDLAATFKTRIELRQVGIRDHARLLGGIGPCGREYCCSSCMTEFQPVSIKMAKEQGLSLNPTKISGNCGKLMCCLKYEQEAYEAALKVVPPVGSYVRAADGRGVVSANNLLKETVTVKFEDENLDPQTIPASEVTFLPKNEIDEMKENAAKAEAEREEKRKASAERAAARAQVIAEKAKNRLASANKDSEGESGDESAEDSENTDTFGENADLTADVQEKNIGVIGENDDDEDEEDDTPAVNIPTFGDEAYGDDEFTELTEEELAALQDEETSKAKRKNENGGRENRGDRNHRNNGENGARRNGYQNRNGHYQNNRSRQNRNGQDGQNLQSGQNVKSQGSADGNTGSENAGNKNTFNRNRNYRRNDRNYRHDRNDNKQHENTENTSENA